MNGEVNYDKRLYLDSKNVSYIVHVQADSEGLSIELEQKRTGSLWSYFYQPTNIEQITSRTGNLKKYNVFVKMLMTALNGSSESVFVEVLRHQDLQNEVIKKNPSIVRNTDPKVLSRRYMIMSYMSEFDRVAYPLSLEQVTDARPDRLRETIRRMAKELECYEEGGDREQLVRQISALRSENQLLKSRVKGMSRTESKENFSENLLNKEIEQQNRELAAEVKKIRAQKEEQSVKFNKLLRQKQQKISQLEDIIKKAEEKTSQYDEYEKDLTKLLKQANQMASALQHAKQNQKKSQAKIANLEKQLQKMMEQIKKKPVHTATYKNHINSPRDSDNGSMRSQRSNQSNKSIGKKKSINNSSSRKKINISSSVYDSETQSSKLHKNGRASPYRQPSRPLASSKSVKNREQQKKSTHTTTYNNISNLYSRDRMGERNRSRSRSKQRETKRNASPPSDNFDSSVAMTEGNGYASDEEQDQVSSTMEKLRNRKKNIVQAQAQNKPKGYKNTMNTVEEKISNIAALMKKFRDGSADRKQ